MDDNPESDFHLDNQDLKVDKLNRRLTLITILIPCLIGAIIFLVYRDINTRVGQVSYSGTNKVKTLSKDLEARFSSLSAKYAQLQKDHAQQLASLEKTAAAVQKNLKEATTDIRYIRAARSSDNKKISSAINVINKTLASIPQDLENISAEVKVANDKFSKEMEQYSQSLESVKNNLIKIQADFIALSSSKIDHKALDLALKNQQKTYQQLLRQRINEIDNKISSLETIINAGKTVQTPSHPKKTTKAVGSDQKSAEPGPTAETVKPKSAPQGTTADKTTLPKPGTFIEQDIK